METITAIETRRSIRKFETKPVENEKINMLMRAAMFAPSARNTQSWHFIIITEKEIHKQIMQVHPYAKMLEKAPLAILVCGDKNLEANESYLAINCSAATQNILLAAQDLNLGSVWLGVYPREERMKGLITIFNLPENILPISLISLGYSNEKLVKPERFLQERIRYNKW